jgi:acyl-coenzyme A thioesterase PaaI-like protein
MLLKETALVRLLGLKIPMLLFLGPRVMEVQDGGAAVLVPLRYRSRNHVGSMYIGAMVAGADLAAGLSAVHHIRKTGSRIIPIFKDLEAHFLKLADGDVLFRSTQGAAIAEAVGRAHETGERVTLPIEIVATVPSRYGDEPVARLTLGLSMKKK